ncbi:MAG TPA: 7TM diverse intracellular signaling domain-containing protein [Candidatus Kryptonia bacterium]
MTAECEHRKISPGLSSLLLVIALQWAFVLQRPAYAEDAHSQTSDAAQQITVLRDARKPYLIGPRLELLEDRNGRLTINDVASEAVSKQFLQANSPVPNFSATKSAIWVRFTVVDSTKEYDLWLLEVGYAMLDQVILYSGSLATGFTETILNSSTPVQERTIRHRLHYFQLPLQKNVPQQFYLRITARTSIPLSLTIRHVRAFMEYDHNTQIVLGIFYGAMLVMILYNLSLFFSIRDKTYLYYVLYVSGYTIYQLAQDGLVKEYLITEGEVFFYVAYAAIGFFILFGVQFTRTYLATDRRTKLLDHVLKVIGAGALASFILSPVLAGGPMNFIAGILAISYGVTGFTAAVLCRKRGFRPATFYMIALSGFFVGFVFRVLRVEGLVPMNFFTQNAFQMGVLWEVTMLSLALGNRVNTLKAEYDREREMTRHRISNDLHDEIGSNLSSIAVASQMMKSRSHLNTEDREQLDDITSAARKTSEAMRDIVWFVNPEHDTPHEMVEKIRETATMLLQDIDVIFEMDEKAIEGVRELQARRNIFLILKEALNNIVLHAKATAVEVNARREGGSLLLCINDNGVGFNLSDVKEGNGLRNIRNRARQMGAHLEVKSIAEKGTEICLSYRIP